MLYPIGSLYPYSVIYFSLFTSQLMQFLWVSGWLEWVPDDVTWNHCIIQGQLDCSWLCVPTDSAVLAYRLILVIASALSSFLLLSQSTAFESHESFNL